MLRSIRIFAIAVGAILIVVGGVLLLAVSNLNSIVSHNRARLLQPISNALGRDIEAGDIKAALGWGVSVDIRNVRIRDDPQFSQLPFIQIQDLSATLKLLPLLSKRIEVSEVTLEKPVIRVVQTADGKLNISTVGRKRDGAQREQTSRGEEMGFGERLPLSESAERKSLAQLVFVTRRTSDTGPANTPRIETAEGTLLPPHEKTSSLTLRSLMVKDFKIFDGQLIFQQQSSHTTPMMLSAINLHLRSFSLSSAFDIDLNLAALGSNRNISLAGRIGPLIENGALNLDAIPVSAKIHIAPLDLASLRSITSIAQSVPPALSVLHPITADATVDGPVGSMRFAATADLTASEIAFGDSFAKPADVTLRVSAHGVRATSSVAVQAVEVTLGDVVINATAIRSGHGQSSARIDTNFFDLVALAKVIPALAQYGLGGKIEIHTNFTVTGLQADKSLALPSLFIKELLFERGQFTFQPQSSSSKLPVNSVNLYLRDFSFGSPFEVYLTLAALGATQDLDIAAKIGPLLAGGAFDLNAIPLSADVHLGPLEFDSLESVAVIAKSLPPRLSVLQPIRADMEAEGTVNALQFGAGADLTANQITLGDSFAKPANMTLKLSTEGTLTGSRVHLDRAELTLGALELEATSIELANNQVSARIDTNRFYRAPIAQMMPDLAKYNLSGQTEIHTDATLTAGETPEQIVEAIGQSLM